jgi:hypothetical protein
MTPWILQNTASALVMSQFSNCQVIAPTNVVQLLFALALEESN